MTLDADLCTPTGANYFSEYVNNRRDAGDEMLPSFYFNFNNAAPHCAHFCGSAKYFNVRTI